jgi:hypothetical protein
MAAQQGFQYEINASNFLKPLGYVPANFKPAGAGSDQPDLMLKFKDKTAGCELKITAASAGSLVLKYDASNAADPWGFGKINPDEDEKIFISDLAKEVKLFDIIKSQWKEIPYKRDNDLTWAALSKKMLPKERYERDKVVFKDIKGEISATKIEQYYNKKATYYVNVGTHGFYLLGNANPLKLKGVPTFGNSAKATYRARVQYKGSGNYQFTFEMQFSMRNKSPFNIAPIISNSVRIDTTKANFECFV